MDMITREDTAPRHCVECGNPIVHRRKTAFYCSGKCREIHNVRKRREARFEMKNAAPPKCTAPCTATEGAQET
jgi:predicted nucleic acid-binding Zn ribbon protein